MMTCKKWVELIEENYEEILEEMEKADMEALRNQHMKFTVYIDDNGTVYQYSCATGSNDVPKSYLKGHSYKIKGFCYQYDNFDEWIEQSLYDICDDVTLDKIRRKSEISEMPIVDYLETSGKYDDIYDKAKEDTIDWIIEDSYMKYGEEIDDCLCQLEEEAKYEEEILQYRS